MAFIKSKEDRARSRQIAREKSAVFEGESMQVIGKIPKGVKVKLTLKPDENVLNIHHDTTDITLPYDRILGFNIANESSDITGKGAEFAKNLFSNGKRGGIIGAGSKLIGGMIPRTKLVITTGKLRYTDKSGEVKELCFLRKRECEYDNFEPDDEEDNRAKEFGDVIESIVVNCGEDITEL